MDCVSLLNRATAAGLHVEVVGNDLVLRGPKSCSGLVAEIRSHKAEVVAELRARAGIGPPGWPELAAKRWGSADPSPGIEVEAGSWREEVARWPIERWLAWRRKTGELLPEGAKVAQIRDAERGAYEQLLGLEEEQPPKFEPVMMPGEPEPLLELVGFEMIAEEEVPAWVDDPTLLVSMTRVHESVEHHRQTREAEARRQSQPSGIQASREHADLLSPTTTDHEAADTRGTR